MTAVKDLAKAIHELSKDEVKELITELTEVYGYSMPEPVVVVKSEEVKEEKASFDVKLEEIGPNKLTLVKLWKNLVGGDMKLMQAKEIIESAPVILKHNVPKDEADHIKSELEAEGAIVSIL